MIVTFQELLIFNKLKMGYMLKQKYGLTGEKHGFHIHTFGIVLRLTERQLEHLNPYGFEHGSPKSLKLYGCDG